MRGTPVKLDLLEKEICKTVEKIPNKIYGNNLRSYTLNKYFPNMPKPNGWIKIKKTKDEQLITDIRNLSRGTKWCTKSKLYAEECIEFGDFYILYKNGTPVLGVRTQNNKIYEIKNKMNKPEYDIYKKDVDELLKSTPELQLFKDNISMLDNF